MFSWSTYNSFFYIHLILLLLFWLIDYILWLFTDLNIEMSVLDTFQHFTYIIIRKLKLIKWSIDSKVWFVKSYFVSAPYLKHIRKVTSNAFCFCFFTYYIINSNYKADLKNFKSVQSQFTLHIYLISVLIRKPLRDHKDIKLLYIE